MSNMPDAATNALSRAFKMVAQYPIPAAIAAAGLAWLVISRIIRRTPSETPVQEAYGGMAVPKNPIPALADHPVVNSARAMAEQASSQVEHLSRKTRELGAEAQDRAEQASQQIDQLSRKARELGAEAQDRAEQASQQIDQLSKKARELGSDAQGRAEHLGSQVHDTVHDAGQDIADTAQKIADRVKSAKS